MVNQSALKVIRKISGYAKHKKEDPEGLNQG